MSACSEQLVHYMHEYLDHEISHEHERELKSHLRFCVDCQAHLQQLRDVEAFVQGADYIQAPNNFTNSVMERLPKEKSPVGVSRWLRRHPVLAAAALFILLMSGTVFSNFNEEQEFSFTNQENVLVEGNTVIIPKGQVVKGDLVVKNGDVRIDGELDGNLTVINGTKYMASSAVITGKTEQIDKLFDWLWYNLKNGSKQVTSFFDGEESTK